MMPDPGAASSRPPHPAPARKDGLQRYVLVLAAVVLTVVVLYYGRALLLLLIVTGIFAFLLMPVCRRLERWGLPAWLAALLSCLLLLAAVLSVIGFLGWQYIGFTDDLPALRAALGHKLADAQAYVQERFGMSPSEQMAWVDKEVAALSESGGAIAMGALSATGSALAQIILIPIFTFFLLLLREKFRTFFRQLSDDHSDTVLRVVTSISVLSRKWLKGVLTVMLVLSVLNSAGFLLLGLKYAILLGVTAAILNIIPYIGPWIGALLPVGIALLTKDSVMYAAGAIGVILITQFIDNNFITPKVVGSSVSINPLASLVALIAGGSLWGVVGLVLAIPITGMLKIVCDEIPELKAWGFLLGEERQWPEEERIGLPFIRRKPRATAASPIARPPAPEET
ncbi:MAG: AI-2E family transporter [Flavobacteriales bacterium]